MSKTNSGRKSLLESAMSLLSLLSPWRKRDDEEQVDIRKQPKDEVIPQKLEKVFKAETDENKVQELWENYERSYLQDRKSTTPLNDNGGDVVCGPANGKTHQPKEVALESEPTPEAATEVAKNALNREEKQAEGGGQQGGLSAPAVVEMESADEMVMEALNREEKSDEGRETKEDEEAEVNITHAASDGEGQQGNEKDHIPQVAIVGSPPKKNAKPDRKSIRVALSSPAVRRHLPRRVAADKANKALSASSSPEKKKGQEAKVALLPTTIQDISNEMQKKPKRACTKDQVQKEVGEKLDKGQEIQKATPKKAATKKNKVKKEENEEDTHVKGKKRMSAKKSITRRTVIKKEESDEETDKEEKKKVTPRRSRKRKPEAKEAKEEKKKEGAKKAPKRSRTKAIESQEENVEEDKPKKDAKKVSKRSRVKSAVEETPKKGKSQKKTVIKLEIEEENEKDERKKDAKKKAPTRSSVKSPGKATSTKGKSKSQTPNSLLSKKLEIEEEGEKDELKKDAKKKAPTRSNVKSPGKATPTKGSKKLEIEEEDEKTKTKSSRKPPKKRADSSPSPQPTKKKKKIKKEYTWDCVHCTLTNDNASLVCEACIAPRATSKISKKQKLQETEEQPLMLEIKLATKKRKPNNVKIKKEPMRRSTRSGTTARKGFYNENRMSQAALKGKGSQQNPIIL